MAQIGDQKGFCASFGRGGEPFPTLLASVTAPFSFWYEGEEQDGFLRVLTPLECERLMGLPENWTKYGCKDEEISDHARYRALGNSIYLIMVVMRRTDVKTAPGEDSWRSCFT